MKSLLTLHLLTILLLAFLHIFSYKHVHLLASVVVSATVTTSAATAEVVPTPATIVTTTQLPSLRAPRHYRATTAAGILTTLPTTATTTRVPKASRRQAQQQDKQQPTTIAIPHRQSRQLTARQSSSSSSLAHANLMANRRNDNNNNNNSMGKNGDANIGGLFESSRLLQQSSGVATNGIAGGIRPNRSLQWRVNVADANSNSNNNDKSETPLKYNRIDSRQDLSPLLTPTTTTEAEQKHQSANGDGDGAFAVNHRLAKPKPLLMPSNDGSVAAQRDGRSRNDSANGGRNATKTLQSQQHQTLKTPRMIQRLVAGHLQNAEGRSTYQVSVVTANSSTSNSGHAANEEPVPLYFRRKPSVLSSSFRKSGTSSSTATATTRSSILVTTTTPSPNAITKYDDEPEDGRNDDEALLGDPGDFDNWDSGILRLSAGAGKESKKSKKNKDDSKKTLADQVRDGKYGLIEKELFRREPKRPGVLSYLPNKEMPYDNERNYGGLNEEDIWLAEDHLLVIKGGSLNDGEANEPWPPIDDYVAPGRQIKIPPNPKVPPPFPVQLEEGGPLQFIGNNKFTVINSIANESLSVYPLAAGHDASAEGDSDDEKNSIARPGSSADASSGGESPTYVYPAPYPPWLYHNQTFVNPLVNGGNARPISFPGLGPFPFGRNGSLDSLNSTDYFDEDDPTLYYPPAYSFVYKNNYSNPVPPGPLVPGIVLPPPPDQFSRLEKPEKVATSTAAPLPPRYRVHATTSTSTTTSSSTTTTTTPAPYRTQVITRISEYTPKTIIVTPGPPPSSTSGPHTTTIKLPPTPPPSPVYKTTTTISPPTAIEPIPVPVAVPIPFYPGEDYPTARPIVTFVPTTPEPTRDTLSNSNPIYYEYFEAKKKPITPATNIIDDFLSTTVKPPVPSKPIKIYATSKRPFKGQRQHYLQPVGVQRPTYAQDNVVIITPKPEVRYKNAPAAPIFKPRPIQNFEREVNAIRDTLHYYQNQQLRDNSIPRHPKAKAVYEYSFDANRNSQPVQAAPDAGGFQPPAQFDEEPFKPMVTYSPAADDENSFRAIAFDKVDNELPATKKKPKYQSTTTLVPVEPEAEFGLIKSNRPKKLRLGAKYLAEPLIAQYAPQQVEYQTTASRSPPVSTQEPWISIDPQQRPESRQPLYSERLQTASHKNRGNFDGYYYGPQQQQQTQQPIRQNNRFYDEPFQNPERKVVNYGAHLNHQQQQQPIWSLENDTYVNYAPNRPPLNPDAEFINPYHGIPMGPYYGAGQRYSYPPPPPPPPQLQPLPPAISHQATYYGPPQRPYVPPPQAPQRQYSGVSQQQQQQQHPMHRDILVNYRQPLPPLNPDAEFIGGGGPSSHPHVLVRNQPQQIYRSNGYRLTAPLPHHHTHHHLQQQQQQQQQHDVGGRGHEQVNTNSYYYLTQKYRRSNNSNNNIKNNSNNKNGNGTGRQANDNNNNNNEETASSNDNNDKKNNNNNNNNNNGK